MPTNIKTMLGLIALVHVCQTQGQTPATSQAKALNLVLAEFPPYAYHDGEKLTGLSLQLVTPVFEAMQLKPNYKLVPSYARATRQVSSGKADGMLLASQNSERDAIAHFSLPLIMNRWSCFFATSHPLSSKHLAFKEVAKIGSVFSSNTHKWLVKHEYKVSAPPILALALPRLLHATDRINAVFLSEAVFYRATQQSGLPRGDFVQEVESVRPFGIYIAKKTVKRYPKLLDRLNAQIRQQYPNPALTPLKIK